jgi:thiol-disulfide isomerase/thioredoxin
MVSSKNLSVLIFSMFILVVAPPGHAQNSTRGIQGQPAPKWNVDTWLNLPAGKKTLDVGDYRGKVLYLYCFQSWCPGCLKYGFPALSEVSQRYTNNDSVAFVAIQTVFEGYSANTIERAQDLAKQFSLKMPVGQSGERGERSLLMSRYRTGGTPWTIIIDTDGIVRYNDFHLKPDNASRIIETLLAEKSSPDAKPNKSR